MLLDKSGGFLNRERWRDSALVVNNVYHWFCVTYVTNAGKEWRLRPEGKLCALAAIALVAAFFARRHAALAIVASLAVIKFLQISRPLSPILDHAQGNLAHQKRLLSFVTKEDILTESHYQRRLYEVFRQSYLLEGGLNLTLFFYFQEWLLWRGAYLGEENETLGQAYISKASHLTKEYALEHLLESPRVEDLDLALSVEKHHLAQVIANPQNQYQRQCVLWRGIVTKDSTLKKRAFILLTQGLYPKEELRLRYEIAKLVSQYPEHSLSLIGSGKLLVNYCEDLYKTLNEHLWMQCQVASILYSLLANNEKKQRYAREICDKLSCVHDFKWNEQKTLWRSRLNPV